MSVSVIRGKQQRRAAPAPAIVVRIAALSINAKKRNTMTMTFDCPAAPTRLVRDQLDHSGATISESVLPSLGMSNDNAAAMMSVLGLPCACDGTISPSNMPAMVGVIDLHLSMLAAGRRSSLQCEKRQYDGVLAVALGLAPTAADHTITSGQQCV